MLEAAARTGIQCRLLNIRNEDVRRLLFPKLVAMNFDQPEAQLFFGLQNKTSCSKCRWRKGYSAFRKSTLQSGIQVQRLYAIANDSNSSHSADAQQKLHRWGFNFQRRCVLNQVCHHLLVKLPNRDEVFPCVDYRDDLHALVMFISGQITEIMNYIPLPAAVKRILDSRLAKLGELRCFRDCNNKSYRLQKSVFNDSGMTAVDKACMVFLLAHVLGHTADIIPHPNLREPLLSAIANAQLLLIASRGNRSYTKAELQQIFDRGYLDLFSNLEFLRSASFAIKQDMHQQRPTQYKQPKPFERVQRVSGSDTSDTDDDHRVGGSGFFSHGHKALLHQHWVMQLLSGGSFGVHSTQSAEAAHKLSAKLAGLRVRHLHVNKTQHSMLKYLFHYTLFEDLKTRMPVRIARRRVDHGRLSSRVRIALLSHNFKSSPGETFRSQAFQSKFVHREVKVANSELMDLLCTTLGLPQTVGSYTLLERLTYTLGQKLIRRRDNKIFWATDTQYTFDTSLHSRRRRDTLFVKGQEEREYNVAAGITVKKKNALCGEAVCFLDVSELSSIDLPVFRHPVADPDPHSELRSAMFNDTVTLMLVRWFEPHATMLRDEMCRPSCPGPLHINHCLWRYAVTNTRRKSMVTRTGHFTAGFSRHRHFFDGHDLHSHQHAYYGLIYPQNVISTSTMTPTFAPGTAIPDKRIWLQSVTII